MIVASWGVLTPIGDSDFYLVVGEAGLRFHLTGPRTWRGLAPYGSLMVGGVVDLGEDRGQVHFQRVQGEGIAAANASRGDWYFAARTGGETIRLGSDRPTRTLKNLLQEREIPMWQREKLPLLFHDGRLVWVPGVGIAAEYACEAGQEGF